MLRRVLAARVVRYPTDPQRAYLVNLEAHLGTSNREPGFDFSSLMNIDSHADRLVVLDALCALLYLGQGARPDGPLPWPEGFVSPSEVDDAFCRIGRECAAVGVEGLASRFTAAAPQQPVEADPVGDAPPAPRDEPDPDLAEEAPDDFAELRTIVLGRTADEGAFGKAISDISKPPLRDLLAAYPDLAPDTIIHASDVGNGCLSRAERAGS